jgi:hypothetical protein
MEKAKLDLAPFERFFGFIPLGHVAVALLVSAWPVTRSHTPVEALSKLVDGYDIAPGGVFDLSALQRVEAALRLVVNAKLEVPESTLGSLREAVDRVDFEEVASFSADVSAGPKTWLDFALLVASSDYGGKFDELLTDIRKFALKAEAIRCYKESRPRKVLAVKRSGAAAAGAEDDTTTFGDETCSSCGDFCGRSEASDCTDCAQRCFRTTTQKCPNCQAPFPTIYDFCSCAYARPGVWLCSGCHLPNRAENEKCRYGVHGCPGTKASSRSFDPSRSEDKEQLGRAKKRRLDDEAERSGQRHGKGGASQSGGKGGKGRKRGQGRA